MTLTTFVVTSRWICNMQAIYFRPVFRKVCVDYLTSIFIENPCRQLYSIATDFAKKSIHSLLLLTSVQNKRFQSTDMTLTLWKVWCDYSMRYASCTKYTLKWSERHRNCLGILTALQQTWNISLRIKLLVKKSSCCTRLFRSTKAESDHSQQYPISSAAKFLQSNFGTESSTRWLFCSLPSKKIQ